MPSQHFLYDSVLSLSIPIAIRVHCDHYHDTWMYALHRPTLIKPISSLLHRMEPMDTQGGICVNHCVSLWLRLWLWWLFGFGMVVSVILGDCWFWEG